VRRAQRRHRTGVVDAVSLHIDPLALGESGPFASASAPRLVKRHTCATNVRGRNTSLEASRAAPCAPRSLLPEMSSSSS
jgi:hypothetical protein